MRISLYRLGVEVERIKILSGTYTEKHQGENFITIRSQADRKLDISIGDYITHESKNWYINTVPKYVKHGNNSYSYDITFESILYDLGKVIVMDNGKTDFYLVGNAEFHLDLIISNLNRFYGSGTWTKGIVVATDDINRQFRDENCLQAIQNLCSELKIYFRIYNKTISLSNSPGISAGLSVEYGKGNGLYELTRNPVGSKNLITRLWVFGGMRNLPSNYRNYSRRLMFADAGANKIEKNTGKYGLIEAVKIFDNIFPCRTGSVTSTTSNTNFLDTGMDFDLNAYLMTGVAAKIHFNTGNLAGYEFEITAYNNSTKTFTIIPVDDMDMTLPNDTLKPAVGDKYKLLDILMPANYVTAAETKLQAEAQKYLDENCEPNVFYSLSLDPKFIRDNDVSGLRTGDTVHIKDDDLGIDADVTIQRISQDLTDPSIIKLDLSDKLEVQIINRLISNEIETNKIVRLNDLTNPAKARMNWKTFESLKNSIFDPDGYFDTAKIKPLSIETGMLSVGMKSTQIILENVQFEPNFGGNPHAISISAGKLVHLTWEDTIKTWDITSYSTTALDQSTGPWYVYARCSRTGSTGGWYLTVSQLKPDYGTTYWHFLVGILHSVTDGVRAFSEMYGQTLINGKFVTTGKIRSADGLTYFDLDAGEIGGKITFRSGKTDAELESEVGGITTGTTPIGGGNLCKNGSFIDGTTGWSLYNNGHDPGITLTLTGTGPKYGDYCALVNVSDFATITLGICRIYGVYGGWLLGKTYIISFWARGIDGSVGNTGSLRWNKNPTKTETLVNPPLTTEWQRYVFRITWGGTAVEPNGQLYLNFGEMLTRGSIWFDGVQVEEGSIPTAFTPCPWDTITDTEAAKTKLETIEEGATVGADWDSNLSNKPTFYRVIARGGSCTYVEEGIYREDNTKLDTGYRSYNLVTWDRTTGTKRPRVTYDVYNYATKADELAAHLNTLTGNDIFALYTDDEPQRNHLEGGLPEAIYRCGGSKAVFENIKYRGAYILIGIGGIGEGNGIEMYSGKTDSDPDAWVETTFMIKNGNIQLSPGKDMTQTVIDGGIITSGRIELGSSTTIKAGIDGGGTAETSVRHWAGATYDNRASAPFRTLQDGSFYSTKGNIAGWIIATDGLYVGTKVTSGFASSGMTLGSGGSIHTPFLYSDASGASFRTSKTGARFEMESSELRLYDSSSMVMKAFLESSKPAWIMTDGTGWGWYRTNNISYGTSVVDQVLRWANDGLYIPKSLNFDRKSVITTSYTILDTDSLVVYNYTGANSSWYLPASPNYGQILLLVNATSSRSVTIYGNGKNIYDSASSYTSRPMGPYYSWILIYNGSAWSALSYR